MWAAHVWWEKFLSFLKFISGPLPRFSVEKKSLTTWFMVWTIFSPPQLGLLCSQNYDYLPRDDSHFIHPSDDSFFSIRSRSDNRPKMHKSSIKVSVMQGKTKWKSIDKFHSVTMHSHRRLSDGDERERISVGVDVKLNQIDRIDKSKTSSNRFSTLNISSFFHSICLPPLLNRISRPI